MHNTKKIQLPPLYSGTSFWYLTIWTKKADYTNTLKNIFCGFVELTLQRWNTSFVHEIANPWLPHESCPVVLMMFCIYRPVMSMRPLLEKYMLLAQLSLYK